MKTSVFVALIWIAALPAAANQDVLAAAKNLYASAAYEDALAALTRAAASKSEPPDIAGQIDQYRAFCLYALGRLEEGDVVVEALVRRDPSLQLNAEEVSPRLAARFTDVRRHLLPSLIRDAYRAGKSALDAKNYAEAEPQLTQARRLLVDAEQLGAVDAATSDLRMLVDGFLELAHGAVNARREAAAINTPAPPPPARVPATPEPAAPTPAPVAAPAEESTIADADVTPPVTLLQNLPATPPALATIMRRSPAQGIVDVVISVDGSVEDAVIRRSINVVYDQLLLEAARHWKYRPALKAGVPVRYTKTILVRAQ